MIFEVFRQERKGQPFVHGGSFHAPDREFADAYTTAAQDALRLYA